MKLNFITNQLFLSPFFFFILDWILDLVRRIKESHTRKHSHTHTYTISPLIVSYSIRLTLIIIIRSTLKTPNISLSPFFLHDSHYYFLIFFYLEFIIIINFFFW